MATDSEEKAKWLEQHPNRSRRWLNQKLKDGFTIIPSPNLIGKYILVLEENQAE